MAREYGYPVNIADPERLYDSLYAAGRIRDTATVLPIAVVQTDDGIATICDEGVGWLEVDGQLTIEVFYDGIRQYIDVPTHFVVDAIDGYTEELADFIRTFGSRLERNFGVWKRQIDGIPQVFEKESV